MKIMLYVVKYFNEVHRNQKLNNRYDHMTYIKVFSLSLVLCIANATVAEEESIKSTTFSCETLRHLQVLRTVITPFDQFKFEVIVKKETVVLTDRFAYGSSNLEFLEKADDYNWLATDNQNSLKKEGKYLYISRLDGVGVKSISAFCQEKKLE